MQTSGNTILITGATSGIGLGLALRWHDAGNTVVVAGRRKNRLDQIVAEHPGIEAVQLDVTDPQSIAACFTDVTARFPQLNVVVNNAGIMVPEDLLDPASLATAEAVITTNLVGLIRVTSAFVPFLAGRDDATIVNTSSGLAFVPLAMTPTYCATKAAVHSLSQSQRIQFVPHGIEVIELIPPAVQTDLMGQTNSERAMPLGEFLDEVMTILAGTPPVIEVAVEGVGFLRDAVAQGRYDAVLKAVNSG